MTGVIAPMTPNGANSVTIIPSVAGHRLDLEVLGPGRLLGDQPVLDDLVVDPAEAGLLDRHPGQRLGLLAGPRARTAAMIVLRWSSSDAGAAIGGRRGGDRLVERRVHAVAGGASRRGSAERPPGTAARRASCGPGLADPPADPLDDVLDLALVDHRYLR